MELGQKCNDGGVDVMKKHFMSDNNNLLLSLKMIGQFETEDAGESILNISTGITNGK